MRQYKNCDPKYRQRKRLNFGIIVLIVGAFFLLQTMHLVPHIGSLVFRWPYLLIAIGLFIGIQTGFKRPSSWILIAVGLAYAIPVFEVTHYMHKGSLEVVSSREIAWPAFLILAGLLIILRRKRDPSAWSRERGRGVPFATVSDENTLDIDVVFAGRKEIVTSKDFKGGMVRTTFGGADINMMQADIQQSPAVLNMQVTFGGVEMVVPSSWDVKNEIQPTLGNYEDNRVIRPSDPGTATKTLVLRGNCTFGNIEIKSY